MVRGWRSKELRLVLPAIAFERRHPIFRGGYAFSLGVVGPHPGWVVLWWQATPSKPVVVGWAALVWDSPAPGQVTVRRIHWPSDGTESKARIALLAATSLTPVGGLSRR